ncbi:TrkH family potassium uptake protein [Pullulanibacillus sp. KACC 23026]|uniref:TrkH family potassium uptake protein n=1 Tax=Pullulanibacillus sp. KACC 23026 TaxID=3028315 RepID=UPI0023B0797C|nr:TrkH family potassium uptake protein [Pullulanibacillus sp. KACC 23026]WEG11967.1 TrkH family potassium uptake protein [Pullulanibacillus sp. KACC 23026]
MHQKRLNPAQYLAMWLIIIILIGTCLLKLPFSTKEPVSWLACFFTATSATTVTGLATFFNGEVFTLFGNIIILILIQLGGLGIMSFAVLIFLLMDKKVSVRNRLLLQEALNQSTFGGIIRLVKRLLIFSLSFEVFIGLLLYIRWWPEFGPLKGFYYAMFHSISAFNNAGFSLFPDNMIRYVGDPTINLCILILVVFGGLGFTVMIDIWEKKAWRTLSVHSKIMIIGTVVMNLVGFIFIFAFEAHNPKTLGSLSTGETIWASLFQGVITRTAGFNTLNIGDLKPETLFLMMIYMFIGAGSISTGGGIKLTTFAALLFMTRAYVKRRRESVIFNRTIPSHDIFKALAITLIAFGVVLFAIFLVLIFESDRFSFLQISYEVISAFGTVGLTTGITPHLNPASQIVICLMMIFGKLGPLTIALSLTTATSEDIHYPKGKLFIG